MIPCSVFKFGTLRRRLKARVDLFGHSREDKLKLVHVKGHEQTPK